jgi:hypothetical protein
MEDGKCIGATAIWTTRPHRDCYKLYHLPMIIGRFQYCPPLTPALSPLRGEGEDCGSAQGRFLIIPIFIKGWY